MAHKKSSAGMSGGVPLSSLRDVNIPANPVPGAALSVTSTGEFGVLDYSQDYFTAKALEVIPPMGAVKMGPGGVLPKTSESEPTSPVVGVSVEGAAVGENAVVLKSGKIPGKVFSPTSSVLRVLQSGEVGTGQTGTIVGTVDDSGVGYVSIGSASSSGGGGGSASVSAAPGNILSEKPDGLYAQPKLSAVPGNSLQNNEDGLYVNTGERFLLPGDVYVAAKGTEYPSLLAMSSYHILDKTEFSDILTEHGDWFYKYMQEEAKVTLPPMTSNTAPAPLISASSSIYQALDAWRAFDGDSSTDSTVWHSNQGANQWISLDFGKEYAMQGFGWNNQSYASPVGNPTSAVLTLTDNSGATVHSKTYTGFSAVSLGTASFTLIPGTTTDKDATIGVVKNVRKLRITVPANQYVITREIPLVLYDNSKVPNRATQFVTPKQVHADPAKEYFLVTAKTKVNADGSLAGGVKDVTISPDAGNMSEMRVNGLYVPPSNSSVSAEPGNIISEKADGLYAAQEAVSAFNGDNTLVRKDDGLYAPPGSATVTLSAKLGNNLSVEQDGLFAQPKLSLDGGNALELKADGLYVSKSDSSDAEYWLQQNPDKTLDDYILTCKRFLPVINVSTSVTKTNRRYKGRTVYTTLVPPFAMGGAGATTKADIPGFPTGDVQSSGIDYANSLTYVTANPSTQLPIVTAYWYTNAYYDGQVGIYTADNRTAWTAQICVWWTLASEVPNDEVIAMDDSGNDYVKGDDAYQVWKSAQDPAADTSFKAWMGAIADSLRLYPELVSSTLLSMDKSNVLSITQDGKLSVDYRTFGVEIKKNAVFLAREGILDDRLFRIADYISETGITFMENWITANYPYTLPYMTGESAPSPMVATGSAQQDTGYAPWKVFDADVRTAFHSVSGGDKWFMLDVGQDICVSGFVLQRSSATGIGHTGGDATVTLYDKNNTVLHAQGGYPFPQLANASYSGTFTKVADGVTQKIILGVRKIRFDFASASFLTLGLCRITAYNPPLDYALDTQSQVLSVFGKHVPTGYEYYIAKEDITLSYTGEVTDLLSNLIARPTPDPIGSIRMYPTKGLPCNAIPCNVPNQLVKDAFRALHYIIGDVYNNTDTIEGNFQLPVYLEPAPSGYCWCIVVS